MPQRFTNLKTVSVEGPSMHDRGDILSFLRDVTMVRDVTSLRDVSLSGVTVDELFATRPNQVDAR